MMMTASVWGHGDGGKWSDAGYGLRVEPGRCADGPDVECGSRGAPGFQPETLEGGAPIHQDGKAVWGMGYSGKSLVSFWTCCCGNAHLASKWRGRVDSYLGRPRIQSVHGQTGVGGGSYWRYKLMEQSLISSTVLSILYTSSHRVLNTTLGNNSSSCH